MTRTFLFGISLIVVSAFASPPKDAAAQGSPTNTTTAYDGTYAGQFVRTTSPTGASCPNFKVAPSLTIRNGVARFAALDLQFHGYVTPQGELRMVSEHGQTFEGHFDPYYVLRGRVTGRCVYDATWEKYKKHP